MKQTPEERRLRHNAYMRGYRSRLSGGRLEKHIVMRRKAVTKWAKSHPEAIAAKAARQRRALKLFVIVKYGGECACCAENIPEFLTIDHVEPIKMSNRQGRQAWFRLYLRLKREPIDSGLQVLCMNCNHAKGTKAECPHKRLYMERSPQFRLLLGGRTA